MKSLTNSRVKLTTKPSSQLRIFPIAAMGVMMMAFAATPAYSGIYCSVEKNLKTAREAVQVEKDRLNAMPKQPASLGTRMAAAANLKAKTALKAKGEAIRNAADAALADHRQITGPTLRKNLATLKSLPSKSQLETMIKETELQLRNQSPAQRTARISLLDNQRSLQRNHAKQSELAKLVAAKEAAIDNGELTSRSDIVRTRNEITELKIRIAKGQAIAAEIQRRIDKFAAAVFPTAADRRAAEALPENRRMLVLRVTLESDNAVIAANDARLSQALKTAEANLKQANSAEQLAKDNLKAVIQREFEIDTWNQKRQAIEKAIALAESAVKQKQSLYDSAMQLKDRTLKSVKSRTNVSTMNTRNKAFQQKMRTQARARVNGLESDLKKRIRNQFSASTEKRLLKAADAYYEQVYQRDQNQAIAAGYDGKVKLLKSQLKALEPFDCTCFTDAQSYADSLQKWVKLFTNWSVRRKQRAAAANLKAKSLLAVYNKIRRERKYGLSDIVVDASRVTIRLWDHGTEDGDVVTIVLNQKYRRQIRLTKAGTAINLVLRSGRNTLQVTADNEGTASPNTASMSITNVTRGKSRQQWSLNTGKTASMVIHSTPQ